MGIVSSKTPVKQINCENGNSKTDVQSVEESVSAVLENESPRSSPKDASLKETPRTDDGEKGSSLQQSPRSDEKCTISKDIRNPVTEAEKNLQSYKKQLEAEDGKQNKDKPRKRPDVKQVYKTCDLYEGGRATPVSARHTEQTSASADSSDNEMNASKKDGSNLKSSPQKQAVENVNLPGMIDSEVEDDFSTPGSILTNTFSHHYPTLLDKRPKLGTASQKNALAKDLKLIGLKPVMSGRLGLGGDKIRTQLAKQGILDSSNAVLRGSDIDPREQGILGELRQVGIIKGDASEQRNNYVMSSGAPLRKPPPRLTHLPPLDNELAGGLLKKFEQLTSEPDPPSTDFKKALEQKSIDDEFFGTFSKEKIGDAQKLQLKVMDIDTL